MSLQIRPAEMTDADGIRRLIQTAFGTPMTAQEWEWKFALNPDECFGVVAALDGEIVGNYSGWGMQFLLDGEPRLLYAVGDVAMDPSVRGLGKHGLYRQIAAAFYEEVFARGIPFCFGFPSARHAEISHKLVGTRTLSAIREVVLSCDAFEAPRPGGKSADFVEASFDRLWAEASGVLRVAATRDRARVNWRFHARPSRYYRMVWREAGGEMESWGVLSVSGERALLADVVGRRADGMDLPDLFATAAAEARRLGATTLALWESPGGPGAEIIARLVGERRDAGFPLIVRARDEEDVSRFARSLLLTPALYDVV
jgi:predicted N-acetyltransferase YhbS